MKKAIEKQKALQALTTAELALECGGLQSAFWNAACAMPPRTITPEAHQRWDELNAELRRRRVKSLLSGGAEPAPFPCVTIRISCHRHQDGVWEVDCPEWKYSAPSRNLTRALALLAAEIEVVLDESS